MNPGDLERLSEYLDGRLSPAELSRLETRLTSDPELAATLQALREARALLRQLPRRKAPRNFTLTPQMVARKPPLPRAYPFLRLATAMAALLFLFLLIIPQIQSLSASFTLARLLPMPAAPLETDMEHGQPERTILSITPEPPSPASKELTAQEDTFTEATPPVEEEHTLLSTASVPETPPSETTQTSSLLAFGRSFFATMTLVGIALLLILRHAASRRWRHDH